MSQSDPASDCATHNGPAVEQPDIAIANLLIESNRFRMQCRIDACLGRHQGDVNAATTGRGIGISYGFARDIVSTFDWAEAAIASLSIALRTARALIASDRDCDFQSFTVSTDDPTIMTDAERAAIAEYDVVLAAIDEVLRG